MVISSTPKSAKLVNGEIVFPNDHVYLSLPWSERDGTPYIIARIIEFLPSNSTPKKSSRSALPSEISVRLSMYYRPSDISGRNVSDFRLLLAAIHTDIQPLSNVRGKCYVRHKDRIEDLISWKRLPDHFYFIKYFDPYIKREYEVLRTENVTNIPQNVRDTLLKRYEYLITEREMVADLTDIFRSCCVCEEWAASQESVRCEECKKHYHMTCLTPPLLAKPAKGYFWVCLPCSMQRRKDIEDHKFHYGNGTAPKLKQAAKSKEKKVGDVQRPDITHRGWPWRYFGLYTSVQDTLDPDDPIFPKAATRVGIKFQANVPSWEEQQAVESHHGFGDAEAGPSRHMQVERGHDIGERKHESTYDIICTPSQALDDYMSRVRATKMSIEHYKVALLDKAAQAFTTLGPQKALAQMSSMSKSAFKPIEFSEQETKIFETELEENGGLDTHKTGKVLGKRPAEVLRFSYIWKNKKLRAENEALRAHHKVNTAHARQNKTLGAPSLGRIRARADSDVSDDEVSLYNATFVNSNSNKLQCAACSTKISNAWWRCPRSVHGVAMCETCGSNYRKYGVISFAKSDDSKKTDKKDTKKKSDTAGSRAITPPPPQPKLPPCACCRRMEPKTSMARCKTCTFSVHSGCYGIAPQDMGPEWECELCANIKLEETNLEPHCVLCPKEGISVSLFAKSKSKKPAADFDLLSAMKPTEGLRWAHILCSAWIPQVVYTKPATFKTVENIIALPEKSWSSACSLCLQTTGAKINCNICAVPFHASCAWQLGHKLGFEFSLAPPVKKDMMPPTVVRFKEEEGVMSPACYCRSHELEGRAIYDMHEIDPEQNETALQIYTMAYKASHHDDSFALIRKAKRLDEYLPKVDYVASERRCLDCQVDVSPRWHETDGMDVDGVEKNKGYLCHQCWFAR